MLRKIVISSAIILFIIIRANSQSQPPIPIRTHQDNQYPTKSTNEQSYKDKYSTKSLETTLKQIISQYQNHNITNTGSQEHHWYDTFLDNSTNWLLVLFNFLLVVVTGLLVLYNCRLWNETAGLLKVSQEQSEHMKTSLAIAQKAADAADKSVYAARETAKVMRAQDRAYVFAKVVLKNPGENKIRGGNNQIEVIATNYGKTPAIIKSVQRFCNKFTNETDIDKLFSEIERVASKNKASIPSGTVIIGSKDSQPIYKMTLVLTDEELHKINALETIKVACLGIIQYEIIVGETHRTAFCWQWEPNFAFGPDGYKHNYYT